MYPKIYFLLYSLYINKITNNPLININKMSIISLMLFNY